MDQTQKTYLKQFLDLGLSYSGLSSDYKDIICVCLQQNVLLLVVSGDS